MVFSIAAHFTNQGKDSAGNIKYACNACNNYIASGASRAAIHIAGVKGKSGAEAAKCKAASADLRNAALQYCTEYGLTAESLKRKAADADLESPSSNTRSRKSAQSSISHFAVKTDVQKLNEADMGVFFFLAENGVPFNVTRTQSWKEMWDKAAPVLGKGWKPPSYNKLREELLDQVCRMCGGLLHVVCCCTVLRALITEHKTCRQHRATSCATHMWVDADVCACIMMQGAGGAARVDGPAHVRGHCGGK